MNLPSEPEWSDGLPRLHARESLPSDRETMGYAVTVPGGQTVALVATQHLAREFIGFLARGYADRACQTMRAMDEIVDPLTNRDADRGLQPGRDVFKARTRGD